MCAINGTTDTSEMWPALPLAEWADTYATLHMWSQVVGKVRLALSPRVNHWWKFRSMSAGGSYHVSDSLRKGNFEVQFDFIDHTLNIVTTGGEIRSLRLIPRTVARFLC